MTVPQIYSASIARSRNRPPTAPHNLRSITAHFPRDRNLALPPRPPLEVLARPGALYPHVGERFSGLPPRSTAFCLNLLTNFIVSGNGFVPLAGSPPGRRAGFSHATVRLPVRLPTC